MSINICRRTLLSSEANNRISFRPAFQFLLPFNVSPMFQQALRIAQFMTLGYSSFGARGFREHSKTFNPQALDVALRGRHVVVTGATSGLGKITAEALAKRHATLHLVVRDEQRGNKVKEDIMKNHSDAEIHVHQCDISSLVDVARLARHFEESNTPVHVLINNAGVLRSKLSHSADGYESAFATNSLGTFALTEMLLPVLEKSTPDVRVITISSGGMLTQNLYVDDFEGKELTKADGTMDGPAQYSRCKRRQVALTEYWARKHKDSGILWASMHPGWADTPGLATSMTDFYNMTKSMLRTQEEGADTIVYLAAAEEAKNLEGGQFFFDRQPASKHLRFAGTEYNKDECERLAMRLRKLVQSQGFPLPT